MNIVIVNLHSAKNLGDDAILRSTLFLVRKKYPESIITLMANDPESWKKFKDCKTIGSFTNLVIKNNKEYKISLSKLIFLLINLLFGFFGITSSLKNDFENTITVLKKADLVLSCGGGNFYSNSIFGVPFLLNCLAIISAGLFKKRIIFLPQSFGPTRTWFQNKILKYALSFSELIYVRESNSIKFLESLKISSNILFYVPDLALIIKETFTNWDEKKLKNERDIRLGLTIIDRASQDKRFEYQADYEASLLYFLNNFLSEKGGEIHFFVQAYGPTDDQNDKTITTKFYEILKKSSNKVYLWDNFCSSSSLLQELSKMDFLIATRMHTTIFGLINFIPTIMIGYQHKSQGLMDLFNLEDYFLSINQLDAENINKRFINLILNKENIIENLETQIPFFQNQIINDIKL